MNYKKKFSSTHTHTQALIVFVIFPFIGAELLSVPNVVMNSLVSPTKVITNDMPNPIAATLNPIALPSIPLPVGSIGVPIMNLKNVNNLENKSDVRTDNDELVAEAIETEDEKLSDTKKSDESMPVEDDTIIEMAHKIEENICENDVEVSEVLEPIEIASIIVKSDVSFEQTLDKSDELNTIGDHLNSTEPMECASVNSMASPKHTMVINDVIMAESISVSFNEKQFFKSIVITRCISDIIHGKHASRKFRHVAHIKYGYARHR